MFWPILASLILQSFAYYPLSNYDSDSGIVAISVQQGSMIYVSSNDEKSALDGFLIENGDKTYHSAYDLANLGNNPDGTKKGIQVVGNNLNFISANSVDVTSKMTGFVYVTEVADAKNENFLVYEVADKMDLSTTFQNQTTFLFLNTDLKNPDLAKTYGVTKSSRLSNIQQNSDGELIIFWDEPYRGDTSTYIFSNPYYTKDFQQFFKNIEPMQLNRNIWRMVVNGPISFTVEKKWENANGMKTSSITTTGLFMADQILTETTINMEKSTSAKNVFSGFDMYHHLLKNVTVSMDEFSLRPQLFENQYTRNSGYTKTGSSYVKFLEDKDQVGSIGIFAVQYYQIDQNLIDTTQNIPTTSTAASTTGSSTQSTSAASSQSPVTTTAAAGVSTTTSRIARTTTTTPKIIETTTTTQGSNSVFSMAVMLIFVFSMILF